MQSISWIMTLLALFGWGATTPTVSHQQPGPVIAHTTPSSKPSPNPTQAPTPTSAPSEIASQAICPGQSDMTGIVQTLTCLTNNARVFHGLKPVVDNQALLSAATAKDQDMAKCGYGHTACGLPFQHEILAKGYTGKCYGENIAMGQGSPHDVFVAWMNSPDHRANILNSDYRDFGVAETPGSQGPLWSMELGGC